MSHPRPMVGLSDSKFDSDLHNDEIDHDFFDNPCINISSRIKTMPTAKVEVENPKEIGTGSTDNKSMTLNPLQVSNGPIFTEQLINGQTNQQPLSLSIKKPDAFIEDDLVTPDTCVSSPNLEYSNAHNQMFSTGKLLECLTQSDDLQGLVDFKLNVPQQMNGRTHFPNGFQPYVSSGPNSSYFNLDFGKNQGAGGEDCDEAFLSQDATIQQHEGSMRMKLFDVSSSSSDGSDSDSDPGSLDTEDEEFVELLEKYYDYIDLGESDYSDITEVSPMSSLTASPLPPFNGINSVEDNNALAAECGDSNSAGLAMSLSASARMRSNHHNGHHILKPKPLPPLIIHTMEEVAGTNGHSNTMHWPGSSTDAALVDHLAPQDHGHKKSPMSLLMKADTEINGAIWSSSGSTGREGQSEGSDFQPGSSSTISTPSRVSFRSNISSASGRSSSSISTGSLAVNKRQAKNHSFTPDQMRRIEKDNSVLLRKILDTNKTHHGFRWAHGKVIHHHRTGHHQSIKASATIARQRQQRRIDHENSILIRRLQNVKPSKEIVDAFGTTNNNVKCT